MRRILVVLVSLGALVLSRPAGAHFCANAVRLEPGQVGGVTVGLASEDKPVVEFVLHLPDAFQLKASPPPTPRWTLLQEGRDLRYTGGPLHPLECMYLTIAGSVAEQGTVVIPMTVKHSDGTIREYTSRKVGDQYAAQLVYVGMDPPAALAEGAADSGDGGGNAATPLAVGATAVGAAVTWWYTTGRKRRRRGRTA